MAPVKQRSLQAMLHASAPITPHEFDTPPRPVWPLKDPQELVEHWKINSYSTQAKLGRGKVVLVGDEQGLITSSKLG